jgi:hypothetical protein
MKLPIFERQAGIFDRVAEGVSFVGKDPASGLYIFEDQDGARGLYARRKDPPAGWHLRRGRFCFEFCRGLHGSPK